MVILGYEGKSLVSRAIRWQTRFPVSHVAFGLDDGSVIEAWHRGGVKHNASISTVHTPGTVVRVYDFKGPKSDILEMALGFIGMEYDFSAVARFLSRRSVAENGKWFCSELVAHCCASHGVKLQALDPQYLSPRDVCMSPLLTRRDDRVTE